MVKSFMIWYRILHLFQIYSACLLSDVWSWNASASCFPINSLCSAVLPAALMPRTISHVFLLAEMCYSVSALLFVYMLFSFWMISDFQMMERPASRPVSLTKWLVRQPNGWLAALLTIRMIRWNFIVQKRYDCYLWYDMKYKYFHENDDSFIICFPFRCFYCLTLLHMRANMRRINPRFFSFVWHIHIFHFLFIYSSSACELWILTERS